MYICDARAFQQIKGPGAQHEGPWLDKAAGTYDVTEKPVVQGKVYFSNAVFTVTTSQKRRLMKGERLAVSCTDGQLLPCRSAIGPANTTRSEPDRAWESAFSIPVPAFARSPSCTYKQVGITLDGVQLHGPLDSLGRDELAYQLQDLCTRRPHPEAGPRHALYVHAAHSRPNRARRLCARRFWHLQPIRPQREGVDDRQSRCLSRHDFGDSVARKDRQDVPLRADARLPYTISCFRGTPTRNAFQRCPALPRQH